MVAMDKPTVGLMMIVRNETAVLPRLAASLAGQLDHWTIIDTGSTDDTVKLARELFADVPGEVIEDEWRGFGPSRMVALRAAEPHTDWLLTMDADEVFHGNIDRRELVDDLDGLAAELRNSDLHYWTPRLVRSGRGWHWQGRTHEYLGPGSETSRQSRTESFWVEHHADGGSRADKWERDIRMLLEDWGEGVEPQRTAFYLALTFDFASRDREAIKWYKRRLNLPGWDQETFYARWRLGVCLLRSGAPEKAYGVLWRAWGERPSRAEPLVTLSEHYRSIGQWNQAWQACELAWTHCGALPDPREPIPPVDALFVHTDVLTWQVAWEGSISAWHVGKLEQGAALCAYLLGLPDLPEWVRPIVEANQAYYKGTGTIS